MPFIHHLREQVFLNILTDMDMSLDTCSQKTCMSMTGLNILYIDYSVHGSTILRRSDQCMSHTSVSVMREAIDSSN